MGLQVRSCFFLAVTAAILAGCSSGGSRPATAPVSGTVTLNGQPLEGATVVFMGEGASQAASGKTDASGKYQLTTFEPNDGAVIGNHQVTITKSDASATAGASAENPDAAYDALMGGGGAPPPKPKDSFTAPANLTATVNEGPNEINFDL